MNAETDRVALNFFRSTPPGLVSLPPLASSLQSFETCLLLIGLQRYPAALIACGSAWESGVKAKLRIDPEDNIKHWKLQERIRNEYESLKAVSDEDERTFRDKRNEIAHYGYSPRDDETCAMLLLKTGLPYLKLMYVELFDFYLDWRDALPERKEFSSLTFTSEEADKVGLIPYTADQLRNALRVYGRVKDSSGVKMEYCFAGLSHYIAIGLKVGAMSDSELEAVSDSENTWEAQYKLKQRLQDALNPSAVFNCPICYQGDSLIAELDDGKLDDGSVTTLRCECVSCGFLLGKDAAFVSETLLSTQCTARAEEILKGYGISKPRP